MDRTLDPVYLEARQALEEILERAGFSLFHEEFAAAAFGSAFAVYWHRLRRVQLMWDGKDRFLGLTVVQTDAQNQYPKPDAWRPLELDAARAPAQGLRPGPGATARIAELRAALAEFIAAAA